MGSSVQECWMEFLRWALRSGGEGVPLRRETRHIDRRETKERSAT